MDSCCPSATWCVAPGPLGQIAWCKGCGQSGIKGWQVFCCGRNLGELLSPRGLTEGTTSSSSTSKAFLLLQPHVGFALDEGSLLTLRDRATTSYGRRRSDVSHVLGCRHILHGPGIPHWPFARRKRFGSGEY